MKYAPSWAIIEPSMEKEIPPCNDSQISIAAEKLKVCGHPVRLKILCLIEKKNTCVNDLCSELNHSQPVISQHLSLLKEKKIVSSSIKGNKRIYSIVDPFVKSLIANLEKN